MGTLVLLPGAWLGSWAWERVASLLAYAGHQVFPVTLPGLADRAGELTPEVGLHAHVADVVGILDQLDLREVVLVAHSYAGAVAGGVVRRAPQRLRSQVYLDTMPLAVGASLLQEFSEPARERFRGAVVSPTGTRVWPMPDPLSSQAPVDGLSAADLGMLRTRGTPHPARCFEETLEGPAAGAGPGPKSHAISCVEDERAGLVERAEFLRSHPEWTYDFLATGHWPMLSTPRELAAILHRLARG